MENTVDLKIALPLEDVQKLADLAGGGDHIAEYLSTLIRNLDKDQHVPIGDVRFEQMISEASLLIEKHKEYKQTINSLRRRLTEMTMNQEELMATVQHLDRSLVPSRTRIGKH